MVMKFFTQLINRLFHKSTPIKLAFASSLGLFLGAIPHIEFRLVIALILSFILDLNLLALIVGIFIAFAGYEIPFFVFNIQPYLINTILLGAVFALLSFPLFTAFYSWGTNRTYIPKDSVFYDITGRRWIFFKRLTLIGFAIAIVITSFFTFSLSTTPKIPNLGLRTYRNLRILSPIFNRYSEYYAVKELKEAEKKHPTFQIDFKKHRSINKKQHNTKEEVFAFYVNWDENSKISLKRHAHLINVLVPEWYHLDDKLLAVSTFDKSVNDIAKINNIHVMPLISNFSNGKWDTELLHSVLNSKDTRNKLIFYMLGQVKQYNFSGINIDFEMLDPKDKNSFNTFVSELAYIFHKNNLRVTIDLPADSQSYDYKTLSTYADKIIVMLYDEHSQFSDAGPVASQQWFEDSLQSVDVPDKKLVAGLGCYGYDWTLNSNSPADPITFGDLTDIASANPKIYWDTASKNPFIKYSDGEDQHLVWFLDGATFYNQLKYAIDSDSSGVAIWRLGSEDPSIWNLLSKKASLSKQISKLKTLTPSEPTHYSGQGEILRITAPETKGSREFKIDSNGYISIENYVTMPTPFEIQRYGKPKVKKVVLTFDDGPDADYTPKILDILAKYKIRAAFFLVGESVEANPELVQRIYREGHEIGNHTFTHPNIADVSPLRTKMELNANQRLIEELTAHSVTLFRPPYVADAEPSTPNELLPILRAQQMGYTMVGELIDPEDWQKPSSDEIVKRVLAQLSKGNIILLHDAGGDRTNTVKALPKIIEALKARGYDFATVSDLLGKKRIDVMPKIPPQELPFLLYDRAVFTGITDWERLLSALFYTAIGLGIFRFIFLIVFASKQKKAYDKFSGNPSYKPHISVIIAAYNEEKVIVRTVNSILDSDYTNFEIIIIDDGSKDNTANVTKEAFANDPRVKVFTKENGGKSTAINYGIQKATGEIYVALDADTLIAKDAISLLIRHFVDPNIAAVSGNVKVGNVHNLITLWQHVEYVTGFNLERRAFDILNCITVVPGAIGAWRTDRVIKAGLYQEDTLAEDTDITLTLLEQGYRIAYEEKAFAYTESPEDVGSLLKQRFRWSFGTLQCLWKHRESLFNTKHKALGFLALPNMWLFQYIFQTVSPLADILFILGLMGNSPKKILAYYIVFFLVDFAASLYAFKLDKENPKTLVWLFLQRIVYRQFMTYVVLKSFVSAVRGTSVGWNKLNRVGNVKPT